MRLFRYSGNKQRYVKHYRKPLAGTKRVVEPYLGSGAYLLSTDLPGLGYEANGDIVEMWKWLQKSSAVELKEFDDQFRAFKRENSEIIKPDVRLMKLEIGPQTYVRINVTGVVVGQLNSWKIYPQFNLPIEQTIACLSRLKDIEVIHGSANDYKHQDGDMLFVDPPYINTVGGYVEKHKKNHEKTYVATDTLDLIRSTSNPIIMTYGDGASNIFPYKWEFVARRKVPNLRRGGTVDHCEYVSYINWPEQA